MDLLEMIIRKTSLDYISDLRWEKNWKNILPALRQVPESDYAKSEWQEVYRYITGDQSNRKAGKKELIEMLKKFEFRGM